MLVKLFGATLQGVDAIPITIEVNASRGCMFHLVGLPDNAVKESRERILSAMQVCGYKIPIMQTVINMAPADIRKEGSAYDLPLALGMMAATGLVKADHLKRFLLMGELSLDGSLRPIKGALSMAIKAREMGFEGFFVPQINAREAAVVNQLKVYGVNNLTEVVDFFNQKVDLLPVEVDTRKEFLEQQSTFDFDFAEVRGQEYVKRAIEVAAAGAHNLIMVGPPGSGKSMMAK
nr:ATP-binding protein [Bacteroidaceae bacterium]